MASSKRHRLPQTGGNAFGYIPQHPDGTFKNLPLKPKFRIGRAERRP
jgi:hypothetical protein